MSSRYAGMQDKKLSVRRPLPLLALSTGVLISLTGPLPVSAVGGDAAALKSPASAGKAITQEASSGDSALDSQLDQYQKSLDDHTLTEAGVQKLAALAAKYPTNSRVHLLFGRAYDALGLADDAVEQYKIADKYGPKDPEAIAAILHNVLTKGGGEAANTLLNSAIERFPNNPKILYMIGKRLRENRHGYQAFKTLKQAYGMGQKVQGLPTELANMVVDREPRRAYEMAQEDLATNPDYAPALMLSSKALIFLGNYQQALGPLRKLFKQAPTNNEASMMYARCLYWCGDYRTSLEPSFYLLVNDSQFVVPELSSATNLAKVLSMMSGADGERALAHFYEKAEKEHVSIPGPFHYFIGRIFYRQNKYSEAKGELLRYLDIDPKSADTLFMLGNIAENYDHDYTLALKDYRLAHALLPLNPPMAAAALRLEQRETEVQNDWAASLRDFFYSIFGPRSH